MALARPLSVHDDFCLEHAQTLGSGLSEKYDGGGGGLKVRISFLEAVYGFRVSFLSLYIFFRV